MTRFFLSILTLFLLPFKSRSALFCQIAVQKKEIEILRRKSTRKHVNIYDKLYFILLNKVSAIKEFITIVKPETLLQWQRKIISGFWNLKRPPRGKGRPPVEKAVRKLILEMKNDNLLWGVKKIQGELMKLDIHLDTKTIWNIIQFYRHRGMVKKSISWKKFLEMQINSICAMDFIVVDTIFNQRLFIYFIIAHKTRRIIRFAITENPVLEFVRQQLIELEQDMKRFIYMIHDNAASFNLDFKSFNIESVRMAVRAPNMNAIAERFVGSVRREALDHFFLLNKEQIGNGLREYIEYYNAQRPHQGISQAIPNGSSPQMKGAIFKVPVLSGLHHHYYRKAA